MLQHADAENKSTIVITHNHY